MVYFQNVGGLRTKIESLKLAVNSSSYDIIVLVESNLCSDYMDSELACSDYNLFRGDRSCLTSGKSSGGGILVYIRKSVVSVKINIAQVNVEQLFISCNYNGSRFLIGGLYIPPQMPEFFYGVHCEAVESVLQGFPSENIYIFGDYNLPEAQWSNDEYGVQVECPGTSNALLLAQHFGFLQLFQLNEFPNRRKVFLDLVFSNDCSANVTLSADPILPDSLHHYGYECIVGVLFKKEDSNNLSFHDFYYDFKHANYVGLNNFLAGVPWEQHLSFSDINFSLNNFYEALGVGIALFVPLKRYHSNTYPNWFSPELRHLTSEKRKFHRKYLRSGSHLDYLYFCRLRSECKRVRETCWSQFMLDVDREFKNNPKHFWKYVRDLKSAHSLPHSLMYNNEVADDGHSIVNLFKKFFETVYVISSNVSFPNVPTNLSENLNFAEISVQDIFNGISCLPNKNTLGPDGIPNVFLKKCICTIVKPLHILFNMSLKSSVFPDRWKNSFIMPIYKSGDKNDVKNYRSVCIQSSIPKLFDSLVSNQLGWLCRNLIHKGQHGFFTGRSTVTNLLLYQNRLLGALEEFKQVDAVYTDFSKAFDRVDHGIFLNKLCDLGFGTAALGWIESFLVGHQQKVRIGSFQSEAIFVTSGVPQGGHCSPIFFDLFVNTIFDCFQNSDALAFADDVKIYKTINSIRDQSLLQDDLNRLADWCRENKLNLNVSKCCFISFYKGGRKFITSYGIGGKLLQYVTKIKDLGVIFNESVSFIDHLNDVTVKSSKMLGFVLRHCSGFSLDAVRGIYCSLVRSKVEYASIVWAPYRAVHNSSVERVQHKFLRFCAFRLGERITDHDYSLMENRLNLVTLEGRRNGAGMLFIYKLVNGIIDCCDLLECISIDMPTRNRRGDFQSFRIPFHRTDYGQNSPIDRYCRLMNGNHIEVFGMTEGLFRKQLLVDAFS